MTSARLLRDPLDLARLLIMDGHSVQPVLDELRPMNEVIVTLNIDSEFKALIPPLTPEEYAALELSLLTEGCRDFIVTWNSTIIDGHNRYEICQRNGIPFEVKERQFPDRSAVIVWMIQNQLGRRNISDYTRGKLALRLKETIAANGKRNMSAGGKGLQNLANPVNTRDELAKLADLSGETIRKVEHIERAAPDTIKHAAESEKISISRAMELTQALEGIKQHNPTFYEETVTRGYVTNLDGEDVPLTDVDPTLLRLATNEDEYERAQRQQLYITKGNRKGQRGARLIDSHAAIRRCKSALLEMELEAIDDSAAAALQDAQQRGATVRVVIYEEAQ